MRPRWLRCCSCGGLETRDFSHHALGKQSLLQKALAPTRKEEALLRQCHAVQSKAIILDMLQTRKDGVLFRDATLASLTEEYSKVRRAFDHEQTALVSPSLCRSAKR